MFQKGYDAHFLFRHYQAAKIWGDGYGGEKGKMGKASLKMTLPYLILSYPIHKIVDFPLVFVLFFGMYGTVR